MVDVNIRLRRSVLYIPAINSRAIEKARGLDVDAIILDLEDSVAPIAKSEARANVVAQLGQASFGRSEVVIRMNGLDTPWGLDDLDTVKAAAPDAVLVPKVSTSADLARIQDALDPKGMVRIWAMLETPLAMLNVRDIAHSRLGAASRLSVLVMGTNDLAKETRTVLKPGRAAYLPWLMQCLAAARAAGLDIVDGVYNDFSDHDGFAAECMQGREIGMDGKTLIHPSQIEPANRTFSPNRQEIAWAQRICAEFDAPGNEGAGVLSIDGKMVERLHADQAHRLLKIAARIGADL